MLQKHPIMDSRPRYTMENKDRKQREKVGGKLLSKNP
ncbi:hypothetical protein LINGRAHAP2_LOCUS3998 [Linum grandiflorum]